MPTHAVVPPAPLPHRPAPRVASWRQFVALGLPIALCTLILALHLGGFALLNLEAARLKWLDKESRRFQLQNEQLRTQLNMLTSEPEVRRWAEAQGMVRAESQNALLILIATPQSAAASSPIYEKSQADTSERTEQAWRLGHPSSPLLLRGVRRDAVGGFSKQNAESLQNLNQHRR